MISSRKPVLRAADIAGEPIEVPLRFVQTVDVESAEAEAQAIIAEAEVRRDQILQDAWNEGYHAGRAEVIGQVTGTLSMIEHMVTAMAEEIAQLPERLAPEVTGMALEVAARIVRAELSVRPERVAEVVRGAIRRASDRERMVVHVNPADLDVVRDASASFTAQIGGITRLDVVDDPRIPSGGCVVETGSGDIDARLSSQFTRLAEALADVPDEDLVEPAGDAFPGAA